MLEIEIVFQIVVDIFVGRRNIHGRANETRRVRF
jgi:hypothetical protein